MAMEKIAGSIADIIAAQRRITITMRDKSGNVWKIDASPLSARMVDAMDRLYPMPVVRTRKDDKGRPILDANGAPEIEQNDDIMREWNRVRPGRAKAALAVSIGEKWFGVPIVEEQIKKLEDLFDYGEIYRAVDRITTESRITEADAEDARRSVAPFESTAAEADGTANQ